jgi:3-carboxy-cis,cis-muconate cycloisomerase
MATDGARESPLCLLGGLYGDAAMAEIFSESQTIVSWLRVEAGLAQAQADCQVLTCDEAKAIGRACKLENISQGRLWSEARNVGYPILPLIRMIAEATEPSASGRVHYGATTQDIMDSGLALQLRDALTRLESQICEFGDALAHHAAEHASTPIAGRTHAQHAVPTTFGAKLAVYLDELVRHLERLGEARRRACVVSLFGAGGTAAALGPKSAKVRRRMAELLELEPAEISWHVARDRLAEFGQLCCLLAATCGRFATEIIHLSRNEIQEVTERRGHHRGASSTMPQKSNPIECEAVTGWAIVASSQASALYQFMRPGHERSAGEWQAEWVVIPQLAWIAASALGLCVGIAREMQVFPDMMRRNLDSQKGLIMAEAYMIRLAPSLGQARAHDLVYAAVREAMQSGQTLSAAVAAELPTHLADLAKEFPIAPEDYLGEAVYATRTSLDRWRAVKKSPKKESP